MTPAKRLRTLLIVVLLSSNFLMLVLSVQSIQQSRQQHELSAQVMTQNVANALDQNLSSSIERIDLALRTVADELEKQLATRQGIDTAAMTAFLSRHEKRLPELEAFRVANADGLVILGKGLNKQDRITWADRDYFIHHKAADTGELHVAQPRMGRVAKQFIIGFSRRYNDPEGHFAGVISAPIALDHFTQRLKQFDLGKNGTIVVRDAESGLITRNPTLPDKAVGQIGDKTVSPELRAIINSSTQATTYYTPTSADGFQRIVSFRRLSKAPILFIVGAASEDYLADWKKEVFKTSTVAASFLLLSLALGGLLWRLMKQGEQREQALSNSEIRLKTIIENEPECIKIVNREGLLQEMNPAGLAMSEADSLEQVKNQPVRSLVAPQYQALFDSLHQRVLAGETVQAEFELIGLKGGRRWVETKASPFTDHGEVSHLAVTRDITARKQAETDLLEHRNHLEKMVEDRTCALSIAKEAAETASRAKSTFLANMSHELRTPMNAIMGMTELVMRNCPEGKQKEQLGKVMYASQHLLAVINDILDISRIEAERLPLEQIDFQLVSVLENLSSLLTQKIEEKGLTLQIAIAPEISHLALRGDPMRLSQVLLNMTSNAVKFTTTGGISIRALLVENNANNVLLRFEVIDSGIGISEKDQQRVFSAFEQADASTTRKYGGTGLGLPISKKLAQLMGGDTGCRSTPGVGSTFWFSARLSKSSAQIFRQPASINQNAEARLRQCYAGRRILLVEDEPINREIAAILLDEVGLIIDQAENGREALAMVEADSYDLVLMDMQMPEMDGLEATRAIRHRPDGEHLPIIALTANAFADDKVRCYAAGMNDFVSKPIDPEALYITLLKHLSARTGQNSSHQP